MTERCCHSPWAGVLAFCLFSGALLAPAAGRADNLDTWIARDVSPWLTEQLSSHPRFRGEPVRVAVFDGAGEDPTPDLLSSAIVDTLERDLSRNPDVTLIQVAVGPDWDDQRLPTRLPCVPPAEAYVVAVESRPTAEAMGTVRIRIFDAQESTWVPGAVREWHGQLDTRERRELRQLGARNDLRGRRDLPFRPGQEDLLSARAAYALGCALLAHPAEDLTLWPGEDPGDGEAGRIARLVPRYLARSGVVRLAGSRSEANMVLAVDTQMLDADIRQVWIALGPADGDPGLPSVRTSVYATTPNGIVASADSTAVGTALLGEREPSLVLAQSRCEDQGCETGTFLLVRSVGSSHVELIAVTREGVVVRLYPATCQSTATLDNRGVLRWPVDAVGRAEWLTVFAVFARTPGSADTLSREFGTIPGACDGERLGGAAARRRLATIERRLAPFGGEVIWRRVHVAPAPGDYRLAGLGRE